MHYVVARQISDVWSISAVAQLFNVTLTCEDKPWMLTVSVQYFKNAATCHIQTQ